MRELLILLLLLFLFLILRLFYCTEGFENPSIDPDLLTKYQTFLAFYQPFLINWEKAIGTALGMGIQQQPLSSPSQVDSLLANKSSPPPFSRIQINTYIDQLSKDQKKSFPPVTDAFPTTIDMSTIPSILKQLPTDPSPYQNALDWMNSQMQKSQQNLPGALAGHIEGFDDTCAQLMPCANDPAFIAKVAEAQQQQQQQNLIIQEKELERRLDAFNMNSDLQQSLVLNQSLAAQGDQLKQQAQNGDLIHQIQPTDPTISYSLPAGSNKWAEIQKNDPARAAEIKDTMPPWIAQYANWRDGINQNLPS